MNKHNMIVLLTGLCFFTSVALARPTRADRRQGRQSGRIQQGVQSGELTRGEAAKLRAGQRHVNRMERRAEADGQVTDAEKAKLERAQDRQSQKIYDEKHDSQKRESPNQE